MLSVRRMELIVANVSSEIGTKFDLLTPKDHILCVHCIIIISSLVGYFTYHNLSSEPISTLSGANELYKFSGTSVFLEGGGGDEDLGW